MTARMSRTLRDLTPADLQRANIPERYWSATFKDVPKGAEHWGPVKTYLTDLESFLDNGEGLYLWSVENGTGKTALATLILRRALRLGYTGYYTRSEAAKRAMQVPERVLFDEATTVEQRLRAVDVLVLDDFGKEYRSQNGSMFTESAIEDLVRERVQRRKVTLYTANIPPRKLADNGLFTVDLADVLRESVGHIEVVGPDRGGKLWRRDAATDLMDRLYDGDS